MTSQTKRFIELSDITGLRLECKKCKCSLQIDINSQNTVEQLLNPANEILSTCPACKGVWASLPDGRLAFDTEVKDFFRRLQQVREIESKLGFSLSMEIKPEVKPS